MTKTVAAQVPLMATRGLGCSNAEVDSRAGVEKSGPPSDGRKASGGQSQSATSADATSANPAPAAAMTLHDGTPVIVVREGIGHDGTHYAIVRRAG